MKMYIRYLNNINNMRLIVSKLMDRNLHMSGSGLEYCQIANSSLVYGIFENCC